MTDTLRDVLAAVLRDIEYHGSLEALAEPIIADLAARSVVLARGKAIGTVNTSDDPVEPDYSWMNDEDAARGDAPTPEPPSSDPVPLHLENTLPRRTFNLRNHEDFAWLRDYFSGYHGVPGLRAALAQPAPALDVERLYSLPSHSHPAANGADMPVEYVALRDVEDEEWHRNRPAVRRHAATEEPSEEALEAWREGMDPEVASQPVTEEPYEDNPMDEFPHVAGVPVTEEPVTDQEVARQSFYLGADDTRKKFVTALSTAPTIELSTGEYVLLEDVIAIAEGRRP